MVSNFGFLIPSLLLDVGEGMAGHHIQFWLR